MYTFFILALQFLGVAIFNNSKTTDDFDVGFQHKGWQLVDVDIVMWGELAITSDS